MKGTPELIEQARHIPPPTAVIAVPADTAAESDEVADEAEDVDETASSRP